MPNFAPLLPLRNRSMEAQAAAAAAPDGMVGDATRGRAAQEIGAAHADGGCASDARAEQQARVRQHAVQHAAQQHVHVVQQEAALDGQPSVAGEANAQGAACARGGWATCAGVKSSAATSSQAVAQEAQQEKVQQMVQHGEESQGGAPGGDFAPGHGRAARQSTLAAREVAHQTASRGAHAAARPPAARRWIGATRRPMGAVRPADTRRAKAQAAAASRVRTSSDRVVADAAAITRRRAEYVRQRREARIQRAQLPPHGRICLDARVDFVAPDGATVTGNWRCGGECEVADSPFGLQAAVMEAMAEDTCDRDAYAADGFRARAVTLRACDAKLAEPERAALAAATEELCAAWAAWNDNNTKGSVTVGRCQVAGNGLFAECDVECDDADAVTAMLRGIAVPTSPDTLDAQMAMARAGSDSEQEPATLLGPIALANAGCAQCASMLFEDAGRQRGVRSVSVRQVRAVPKGEQICVYYKPQGIRARCVLCAEPIH